MPETTTTIQTSCKPRRRVAVSRNPQPATRKRRQRLLVALGIQICGLLAALMVTIAPVQAQPYEVSLAPQSSFVVSTTPTATVNFITILRLAFQLLIFLSSMSMS